MANNVYLGEDGIIYDIPSGIQDEATVADVIEKIEKIMHELQAQNKPMLLLVDGRSIGKTDSKARKIGSRTFLEWPYKKMAVFGANKFFSSVLNLMLLATNHRHDVRLFNTQKEAKAWLLET